MQRRRFDRLVLELTLALDRPLPRFALWQAVHDAGLDPERWSGGDAERFCRLELPRWLRHRGYGLSDARVAKIARTVARFDPTQLCAEDHFARLSD